MMKFYLCLRGSKMYSGLSHSNVSLVISYQHITSVILIEVNKTCDAQYLYTITCPSYRGVPQAPEHHNILGLKTWPQNHHLAGVVWRLACGCIPNNPEYISLSLSLSASLSLCLSFSFTVSEPGFSGALTVFGVQIFCPHNYNFVTDISLVLTKISSTCSCPKPHNPSKTNFQKSWCPHSLGFG